MPDMLCFLTKGILLDTSLCEKYSNQEYENSGTISDTKRSCSVSQLAQSIFIAEMKWVYFKTS